MMAVAVRALALLASVVAAQNSCSIVPIYIDFHDRAVDGGINTQYGLFSGIGFPSSQNQSIWPSLSNNETTVASLDYCSSSPFHDCLDHAHGFYSPDLSEKWVDHTCNETPLADTQSQLFLGLIVPATRQLWIDTSYHRRDRA